MKRILAIAILFAQPAYAAHPDSKGDFFYKNKYTGEKFVIKYQERRSEWTEALVDFPGMPRARWQVRCDKKRIRVAWGRKPYEKEFIGKRNDREEVDRWRSIESDSKDQVSAKYYSYSCRGPEVFLRYWHHAVQLNSINDPRRESVEEKCMSSKDYVGCMRYYGY